MLICTYILYEQRKMLSYSPYTCTEVAPNEIGYDITKFCAHYSISHVRPSYTWRAEQRWTNVIEIYIHRLQWNLFTKDHHLLNKDTTLIRTLPLQKEVYRPTCSSEIRTHL